MKCSSPDHNGLIAGAYSGPTAGIEQQSFAETLNSLAIAHDPDDGVLVNTQPQTTQSRMTAEDLLSWSRDYPELAIAKGTYTVTGAEFQVDTRGGLVSAELMAQLALKEPITPESANMQREFLDVSGCGPLITAACVYVAKSVPWESVVCGGTTKLSTRYSGTILPPSQRDVQDYSASSWQVLRPFDQSVHLEICPDRTTIDYVGHEGRLFGGRLYITGSMVELVETAAAQAAVLSHVLNDGAEAERTVAHVYGGSQEALQEAWCRALAAETPAQAAELAYSILTQ